jgi:hypothetical protein
VATHSTESRLAAMTTAAKRATLFMYASNLILTLLDMALELV